MTHAQFEMGNLATSPSCRVDINNMCDFPLVFNISLTLSQWVNQVIIKDIMDIISHGTVDTHWFFFCCGAFVNVPSSFKRLKSIANKYVLCTLMFAQTQVSSWKPANLFAFDAPSFHLVFATTFVLDFFQSIIIDRWSLGDVVGLLFSS